MKKTSLDNLLGYIQDCHGVTPYDLSERDINVKSKRDVWDAIECYGWAKECQEYLG